MMNKNKFRRWRNYPYFRYGLNFPYVNNILYKGHRGRRYKRH